MSLRILITGRVQGVGFRFYARGVANKYNISGTVENLDSGDVEILANGSEKNLEEFTEKIKNGPMLADVKNFEVEKIDEDLVDIGSFKILR